MDQRNAIPRIHTIVESVTLWMTLISRTASWIGGHDKQTRKTADTIWTIHCATCQRTDNLGWGVESSLLPQEEHAFASRGFTWSFGQSFTSYVRPQELQNSGFRAVVCPQW